MKEKKLYGVVACKGIFRSAYIYLAKDKGEALNKFINDSAHSSLLKVESEDDIFCINDTCEAIFPCFSLDPNCNECLIAFYKDGDCVFDIKRQIRIIEGDNLSDFYIEVDDVLGHSLKISQFYCDYVFNSFSNNGYLKICIDIDTFKPIKEDKDLTRLLEKLIERSDTLTKSMPGFIHDHHVNYMNQLIKSKEFFRNINRM